MLLVSSTPVRSSAPACPWPLQNMMSHWQPHCSNVRSCVSPLPSQAACIHTACTRNFSELKLLLHEISPSRKAAGFPEVQGSVGDQAIWFFAFMAVQTCPLSRWGWQYGVNCTSEAQKIAGIKGTIINHEVAYIDMSSLMVSGSAVDDK